MDDGRRFVIMRKTDDGVSGRYAEVIPFNGTICWLTSSRSFATRFPASEIDRVLAALGATRAEVRVFEVNGNSIIQEVA